MPFLAYFPYFEKHKEAYKITIPPARQQLGKYVPMAIYN
jgi:hypothetical protein